MKKYIFAILSLIISVQYVYSQDFTGMYISKDAELTIASSSDTVYVNGTLALVGDMNHSGLLSLTGNLENENTSSVPILGKGIVEFVGSQAQVLKSTQYITLSQIHVNKTAEELKLQKSVQIDSAIHLFAGNINLDTCHVKLTDYKGMLVNETSAHRIYSDTSGYITLTHIPLSNQNTGGMGLVVKAPSHNFGVTTIQRSNQAASKAGRGSIYKKFQFVPSVKATTAGSVQQVKLAYHEPDVLKKGYDEANLELYYKTPAASEWLNKAGTALTSTDTVATTAITQLADDTAWFTMAPPVSVSSCSKGDSFYVEPRFLMASEAVVGDTVHIIDLSQSRSSMALSYLWAFGDGTSSNATDPSHVYKAANTYTVQLNTQNSFCKASVVKFIEIAKNLQRKDPTTGTDVATLFEVYPVCYPVPTDHYVYFATILSQKQTSMLRLTDMQGRELQHWDYHQAALKNTLDMSKYTAGMYMLMYEVASQVFVQKIIYDKP